jgi:hypothetical protein
MRWSIVLVRVVGVVGLLVAVVMDQRPTQAQKPPPATPSPPPVPVREYVIPTLTDEDRATAIAVVANDPAIRSLLNGRTWSVTQVGVWHFDELKVGALVLVAVDPPLSGRFDAPGLRWRSQERRGETEVVTLRDANGAVLPASEQFDLVDTFVLTRNATGFGLLVSFEHGRVVQVHPFNDASGP